MTHLGRIVTAGRTPCAFDSLSAATAFVSKTGLRLVLACALPVLAACSTPHSAFPRSGPTTEEIRKATEAGRRNGITLVPITEDVALATLATRHFDNFSKSLVDGERHTHRIGAGDTLEISVWEAPPATLFGVPANDPRLLGGSSVVTTFPAQVVDSDGTITVPFAGRLKAGSNTPREVEGRIAAMLRGKTNQLQVLVRIANNASANVTVLGEVRSSSRVALTPTGEKLLDVVAAAGGVTQPVGKMTLQVTRGERIHSMPLNTILSDPRQNILMQPGDVVTALHQPYSFSILGASGKNEEVPFEAQGVSLTQAIARAGGLNDSRADPRGVFVFRFEEKGALSGTEGITSTKDGKVPVVYHLDFADPASFLVAQRFAVNNGDVIYVSNAPAAELQKFLNIVTSIATPILTVRAVTR